MKIELRDPADLHLHRARLGEPEWAQDDPDYVALLRSVQVDGILQPLIVDEKGRVMDGWRRRQAAHRMQMTEVPVVIHPTEEVHSICLATLLQRRHYTKSALAYLAYPHVEPAFKRAQARQAEIAKNPNVLRSSLRELLDADAQSAQALAESIGITRRFLFHAAAVHREFDSDQTYPFIIQGGPRDGEEVEMPLREWFEPLILRAPIGGEHEQHRPLGLGAVLAGIAGVKSMKGRDRPETQPLRLFREAMFQKTERAYRYWTRLSEKDRKLIRQEMRERSDKLPPEEADGISLLHLEVGQIYQRAAQAKKRRGEQ